MQDIEVEISQRGYGLSSDVPLKVEDVIKSCYSNPDRKKFPDFSKTSYSGWDGPVSLYSGDNDSLDFFLGRIKQDIPTSAEKFNQAGISLHSTEQIWDFEHDESMNAVVNKQNYAETIKQSDWYGPYKADNANCYMFYSIVGSGDNRYFVAISLNLWNSSPKEISIYYKTTQSYYWIANSQSF